MSDGHRLVQFARLITPTLEASIKAEAQRRDVSQAAVMRWSLTLGLRELERLPPRPAGRNVSNEMPPVVGPVDARIVDVWQRIAERRLVKRGGRVVDPSAWMRKVAINARRELTPRAAEVLRSWPDLTVDELARVLDGETEPLRYARRTI